MKTVSHTAVSHAARKRTDVTSDLIPSSEGNWLTVSAIERPYHRRVVAGAVAAATTGLATLFGKWDGVFYPAAMRAVSR
jgi:hypothetical protein